MTDAVNHPPHYRSANGIEVIDVIEGFDLGFHEGNVVKYLLRWRQKGGVEDLEKSRWYLDRFIKREIAKAKADAKPGRGR